MFLTHSPVRRQRSSFKSSQFNTTCNAGVKIMYRTNKTGEPNRSSAQHTLFLVSTYRRIGLVYRYCKAEG